MSRRVRKTSPLLLPREACCSHVNQPVPTIFPLLRRGGGARGGGAPPISNKCTTHACAFNFHRGMHLALNQSRVADSCARDGMETKLGTVVVVDDEPQLLSLI